MRIAVSSDARQCGKTTALLDVALANARRGRSVVFLSPTMVATEEAFHLACQLIDCENVQPVSINRTKGMWDIRYKSGGRVSFCAMVNPPGKRVYPVDMEIVDGWADGTPDGSISINEITALRKPVNAD